MAGINPNDLQKMIDAITGTKVVPAKRPPAPSLVRFPTVPERLQQQMDKYDLSELLPSPAEDEEDSGLSYGIASRAKTSVAQTQMMMNACYGSLLSFGGLVMKDLPFDRLANERKAALAQKIRALDKAPAAKLLRPGPDYVQTLTGWRGWKVKDEKLHALGTNTIWTPKKAARAKCNASGSHRAPQKACKCGYWSFKSMDLITAALADYVDSVDVVGTVEIWGRVIECENGYRAEYAYPKELWLLKPELESLSWTYGVPVREL